MQLINNLKLNVRILVAFLIPLIAFVAASVYDARSFADREVRLLKAELVSLMDVASSTVDSTLSNYKDMSLDEQRAYLERVIGDFKYAGGNYFFVVSGDGDFVVHPNKANIGRPLNIAGAGTFIQEAKRKQHAFVEYQWDGENKISYGAYIPRLDWIVVSGMSTTSIDGAIVSRYYTLAVELVVGFIVFAIISKILTQSIVAPLREIGEVMSAVEKGDITKQIAFKDRSELGTLASDINNALGKFREMMREVVSSIVQMEGHSVQLSVATEQGTTSLKNQQRDIEMLSAAMTEMSASISEVAQNVGATADSASKAEALTTEGLATLNQTVDRMTVLSQEISEAAESVTDLAKDTDAISTIVTSIEEVAEQTNLLALNAAIEAARAGEYGRGFAVVADEVRNLSKRTGESTEEIRSVIQELQSKAQSTVTQMTASQETFQEVFTMVGVSHEAMGTISTSMSDIESMATQIATATEEQSSVSNEISESVNGLSQAANETAAASQSVSEAATDLSKLAADLDNTSKDFTV